MKETTHVFDAHFDDEGNVLFNTNYLVGEFFISSVSMDTKPPVMVILPSRSSGAWSRKGLASPTAQTSGSTTRSGGLFGWLAGLFR